MFSCETKGPPDQGQSSREPEGYEDVDEDSGEEDDEEEDGSYCESCDRVFCSREIYEKHRLHHRVCGIDGCQFEAVDPIVERHIEHAHITGLYDKIRNISTPEDIIKWREDRRLRYPSKENIQKRCERQEERFKRGEKLKAKNNRFGNDKTSRLAPFKRSKRQSKKQPCPKAKKIQPKAQESLIDDKNDWNGTMFPFKGTNALYGKAIESEIGDYDDDEWDLKSTAKKSEEKQFSNALGALMGAYMSGDDSSGDGEPPEEVKIEKEQVCAEATFGKLNNTGESKRPRKRLRNKKSEKVNTSRVSDDNIVDYDCFSKLKFHKRKVTLLEKLLDGEIRHERNVLLQCVQHVVGNNFFKNQSE